jgi:H+/Cl- antiporter ClcA
LQTWVPGEFLSQNYVWIAATIGGLLVGLSLPFMGLPGEVAFVVDKVHDPGRIEMQQTPAMIVVSLFSIVAGGSAGPEAPLVQVNGSVGDWLGTKMSLSLPTVRILTFCGMSAALGAFFGAPLGGALFALEIPHRRGLEYYEALIPAVVSAIMSFTVFRFSTGLSIGGMYHFESIPPLTLMNLLEGAILGAVGATMALLFVLVFRVVGYLTEPLHHQTVLLATLGGLSIGLIALVFPQTLFFGEKQIDTIIEHGASYGIALLLMIGLAKMLAISCTLHSGFRGGFIFPLFYIGERDRTGNFARLSTNSSNDRDGLLDGRRQCRHYQNADQHDSHSQRDCRYLNGSCHCACQLHQFFAHHSSLLDRNAAIA